MCPPLSAIPHCNIRTMSLKVNAACNECKTSVKRIIRVGYSRLGIDGKKKKRKKKPSSRTSIPVGVRTCFSFSFPPLTRSFTRL